MGYDSDGRETSGSEEEKLEAEALRREFAACSCDEVFRGHLAMDPKQNRGGYGQKRNFYGREDRSNYQKGYKQSYNKNQEEHLTAQNVKLTQEYNENLDDLQETNEDDEEYEIIPPTWNDQLINMGYDKNKIECPNSAVQTILCCIKNGKVHEFILEREAIRRSDQLSLVSHLGFSGWLVLLPHINRLSDKEEDVYPFMASAYDDLARKVFNWTNMEDESTKDFILGITALEEVNGLKCTHTKEEEQIRINKPADGNLILHSNDDLFGADILTEEDKAILHPITPQAGKNQEIDFKFTLRNCLRFPIIPERLVESHGLLCNQAIWRTKNFGALAPISEEAWMLLGDVSKEKVVETTTAAYNMIRMKRTKMKLAVNSSFFDKKCKKSDLMVLAQKGHMAYTNMKRDDFYLKRLWRTMCPYFKCICDDKGKGKSPNQCNENMIWFDHGIWYMLNNLNKIYPNMSTAGQMVAFRNSLKTTLKEGVANFLAYLEVRRILVGMTLKLAENPEANLKEGFPKGLMTDICEKTIKSIDFLKGTGTTVSTSSNKLPRQSISARSSDSKITINAPPRVTALPSMDNSESTYIEGLQTPGGIGHSVTKGDSSIGQRNMGDTAQQLKYDK